MQTAIWQKALKSAADFQRAKHFLAVMAASAPDTLASASEEQARILSALWSGSQAMSNVLARHPEWIAALTPQNLQHPRWEQGLRQEIGEWLPTCEETRDYAGALAKLRLFQQREMLRIAARDLARLGDAPAVIRELSNLADVCLSIILRICSQQLSERLGQPYHRTVHGQWHRTQFTILGLGKLGGQELNYSSDVDVMFVYSEEGHVFKEPPQRKAKAEQAMSNHQYFRRLAEAFIAEATRTTAEGTLYRVDLRLRPEGEAGPLVRSLSSYENFYAQWGQTWERMMLIKARCVAGDGSLAGEFLEMVQPFRYPRSLSEGALREIAAMKARIETEIVRAGELDRNVKLGRGGIREIEFVAQTLQLLHGGRVPFLQGAQTLAALDKLVEYHFLEPREAESLKAAYCFLREVEHRLQMENNLQTHSIPAERQARQRLARLMGFARLAAFEAARAKHCQQVRSVYDRLLKTSAPEPVGNLPRQFTGSEAEWKALMAAHGFRDVAHSFRLLAEFVQGPGYIHVSQRTSELAQQLLPRLFALCPTAERLQSRTGVLEAIVLSDPDRVLARLDSFISAYGARAMMFETWASNPSLFGLLVLLFDRSEFLAEMAIRTPDLVEELLLSGRLRRAKSVREILEDLRHGRADKDQHLWLRRYHEAEFMRIGLRDILGLADFEQNLAELSALADACLQYALEVVLRKHQVKKAPFAIIGLGKLGGQELNYGSDLDIIFVADSRTRDLPGLQKLAVGVMDLLSRQTEKGIVFVTDARLRPDGEKGLLVNTLKAYEEYYCHRGQLWEIQALTRTRPSAGDLEAGARFQAIAAALTNFQSDHVAEGRRASDAVSSASRISPQGRKFAGGSRRRGAAAYTRDWKKEIARMRQRIEKERTPRGQDAVAIKTGCGGLIDAEFIAQTLSLEHGWQEANTLRALERARVAGVLPDAPSLIDHYRKLRRIEGVLRRWSFEGETVLPADSAAFYRVAIRCGFATAEAFRQAVSECRRQIRAVYERIYPPIHPSDSAR